MGTVLMFMGTVGFLLCLLVLVYYMLAVVKAVLPHDPPPSPEQFVGRLGSLVDDETRARLHQRMRSAR